MSLIAYDENEGPVSLVFIVVHIGFKSLVVLGCEQCGHGDLLCSGGRDDPTAAVFSKELSVSHENLINS